MSMHLHRHAPTPTNLGCLPTLGRNYPSVRLANLQTDVGRWSQMGRLSGRAVVGSESWLVDDVHLKKHKEASC